MTAVDEWDDVGTVVDDFRRDQWDRPLIMQADGTRTGYTRSSTAAKTIEDTYNLERWARRNVAYGMTYDGSLVARLLAIGSNPAGWDKAEKDAVNKICEDAEKVAQAYKGADIGTALHHLTHRLDRGEDVEAGPYTADLDSYRRTMAGHSLQIAQEYIECRIVNDLLRMAGSADRIVQVDGVYRIADIKTGASVDFGALGWSAQLAAYAGGQLYDVTTEQRIATPPIDQTTGYIIHLPAGKGRCDIYEIDLVAGHRAAELANQIRQIRREAKQWLVPKSTWVVPERPKGDRDQEEPAPDTEAMSVPPRVRIPPTQVAAPSVSTPDVERQAGEEGPPSSSPAHSAAPSASITDVEQQAGAEGGSAAPAHSAADTVIPPPVAQPAPTPVPAAGVGAPTAPGDATSATRRQGLLDRYHALSELDRKRFKTHLGVWENQDLDLVESVLVTIEATANRSRPPVKVAGHLPMSHQFAEAIGVKPAPGWTHAPTPAPDEGDLVDDVDINALKYCYNNLTPDAKQWVAGLVAEGNTANVPWNTGTLHSTRRYQLGRAAVAIAAMPMPNGKGVGTREDAIRGLLDTVGDNLGTFDDMPLGAAIGSLDHIEATRFAALVDDYLIPHSVI
jgi:hypothetical protein